MSCCVMFLILDSVRMISGWVMCQYFHQTLNIGVNTSLSSDTHWLQHCRTSGLQWRNVCIELTAAAAPGWQHSPTTAALQTQSPPAKILSKKVKVKRKQIFRILDKIDYILKMFNLFCIFLVSEGYDLNCSLFLTAPLTWLYCWLYLLMILIYSTGAEPRLQWTRRRRGRSRVVVVRAI